MKRFYLLTTLLSALALTSCNDSSLEWGTYADSAAYVTTHIVEALDDPTQEKYYFTTDNGQKIFLADNQLSSSYEFVEQERFIAQFTIIEDYSDESDKDLEGAAYDCDYGLRLFDVVSVYHSEAAVVTTEAESDEIVDQMISYIYSSISYGYGYVNIIAGIQTTNTTNVKFYLVENLSTDPSETKEGYLNLELRYDSGNDDIAGLIYDKYVSLDLSPFAVQLEGKDGVMIRFNTLKSETFHMTIDIDDEEESSYAFTNSLSRSLSAATQL